MQMPVRVVYQVGMDFVGEDQYVVLHAQFADARQFFPGEDAPGRIVRIRHQQRFRSGQLAVQIVEVDDEPSVRRLYQRIFENAPSVETGLPRERMIHRRLDYDSVSFRCECPERENDPRYDSRREVEPLAAQLPASVPFDPADDGVPIGVRPVGIAQNGMFRPLRIASVTSGGAAKSISATQSGMTSSRPKISSRRSNFSQEVPSRHISSSKLYFK